MWQTLSVVGTSSEPENRVPTPRPPPLQSSIVRQAHKENGELGTWTQRVLPTRSKRWRIKYMAIGKKILQFPYSQNLSSSNASQWLNIYPSNGKWRIELEHFPQYGRSQIITTMTWHGKPQIFLILSTRPDVCGM